MNHFHYYLIRELSDCLFMRAFYLLSHFRAFFQQVQHGGLFAIELVSCAFKCTVSAVFVTLCHIECLGRPNFADFKIYKICVNCFV